MTRYASATGLVVGLTTALLACPVPEEGICLDNPQVDTRFTVTVDGEPATVEEHFGESTCELLAADVVDGTLSMDLDCINEHDVMTSIQIDAPASALPAGVAVGDSLQLELNTDPLYGYFGLEMVLSDARGPIVGAVWGSGRQDWAPIAFEYATHCDGDPEYETVDGYLAVDVDGGEPEELFPGIPGVLSDGTSTWDAYPIRASDACCHSSSISLELVRR